MLRQLINDLRARPPMDRDELDMATLLARTGARWAPLRPLPFRQAQYTRTCAYRDDQFEVLLLNWAPGAISALHDHADQHCWMFVLDGALQVEDYARLDAAEVPGVARVAPRGRRTIGPSELDLRSGRFDLHRVSAAGDAPALSLHVYAGPLRSFLVYDETTQRCKSVVGTYDEVLYAYTDSLRR